MKPEKKNALPLYLMLVILAIGIGFRLVRLGNIPLSDAESNIAMQAQAIAEGTKTSIGSHVMVLAFESLTFFLMHSTDFLARFWPAVFGALIVMVPYLFRKQIGVWPAVGAAFFLAISPEMVATSRIIGSPMVALVFLLCAGGFLYSKKPALFGISFALGLMSGLGFWMGGLIIGLSYLTSKFIIRFSEPNEFRKFRFKPRFFIIAGIAFGLSILIVSTAFLRAPYALSGVFSGLVAFIGGLKSSNTTPWFLIPLALLAYSSGALLFGVWGSVRGFLLENKLDVFLACWWLVGMVIIFIYPGSNPADLVWTTFPLWLLTARVIYQAFRLPKNGKWLVAVTAILIIIITAFMLLALRSILNFGVGQGEQINYLIAILGGLVLLVALIFLIGFVWSEEVALSGLLMGILVVMSAGMVSMSVKGTGLGSEMPLELWYPDEPVLVTKWMEKTVEEIIDWNGAIRAPIEIIVADFDSLGMQWALRNYEDVFFEPTLSPVSEPGILITDIQTDPKISSGYRGQDLVWSQKLDWDGITPYQVLNWLVTRNAPTNLEEIILWVRTDLMPDAQFAP